MSQTTQAAKIRMRRKACSGCGLVLGGPNHIPLQLECPVMRYHRQLMMAILHDKTHPAKAVGTVVIPLDEAPQGYRNFDQGVANKFILDPHNTLRKAA